GALLRAGHRGSRGAPQPRHGAGAHRCRPDPGGGAGVTAARRADWLPPLVVFVAALAVWEVAFTILSIPSFLIPRPSAIWTSLQAEWPTLAKGVLYTASEALGGLPVGVPAGTLAGLATSRWATARETLIPLGTAMSAVPII